MKLLVFAHTPPPHHGQSYMVKLMLDGFGGDHRKGQLDPKGVNRFGVECYHVNARLSKNLEDIGTMRPLKFMVLFWHCLHAIWCRYRYGVDAMYYIPAPGKRVALIRDWLVMAICRPFFKRLILHWHAAGLGKWLETAVQFRVRSRTYHALGKADVSIVLSNYNRADAQKLLPKEIEVVHNGIEDPCPDFEASLLARRRKRLADRKEWFSEQTGREDRSKVIRIAYLAHCTREKGVFAAAESVLMANETLAGCAAPCRMVLSVGGSFLEQAEAREFSEFLEQRKGRRFVKCLGFVSGDEKRRLLEEADLFCFPTCFPNENAPVNVIEAIAYGLPVVTTRWRSVPELLPPNHPGLVPIRSPRDVAEALLRMAELDCFAEARKHFLDHYLLDRHLDKLAQAIRTVGAS